METNRRRFECKLTEKEAELVRSSVGFFEVGVSIGSVMFYSRDKWDVKKAVIQWIIVTGETIVWTEDFRIGAKKYCYSVQELIEWVVPLEIQYCLETL